MMEGLGFNRYQEHRETGIDWIEQIPADWKTMKAKFLLTESNSRSVSGDENLLSLSKYHGVIRKDQMSERAGQAESLVGYKEVEAGDLVINKMQASNGLMAVSQVTGITSPDYAIYKAKKNGAARIDYICHVLRQPEYLAEIKRRAKGVMEGFIRLYTDDLFDLPIILPPLQEQQYILDFLDDKCAKIDGAVKIKEDQIALLRERRQIIIQDAVTRGLNPAAPMKDSGIDWIGQIPAHWDVKRLASFGSFSKGGGFSKSDLAETGTDAVLYGDIYTQYDFVIDNPVRKISKNVADQSVPLSQGDLLFTGSGETKEDIGKCVLFRGLAKAVSGGDVIIFRQSQNHPLFLTFCLNSHGVVEEKAKSSKGEIIVHTYGSALKNIYIPVPPLDEQAKIANWVWDSIGKIAAAISMKQDQIAALKEYKTSLINAAVTGKIKVI